MCDNKDNKLSLGVHSMGPKSVRTMGLIKVTRLCHDVTASCLCRFSVTNYQPSHQNL